MISTLLAELKRDQNLLKQVIFTSLMQINLINHFFRTENISFHPAR